MIDESKVAAVVVTRGDRSLTDVLYNLHGAGLEVVVWDNSREDDVAVYGRYAAESGKRVHLVQDDDVILSPESIKALLTAYEPGVVTAIMPQPWRGRAWYKEHCLVGFGAIFDRGLPERAFTRFALSSHRNGCIAWGAEGQDIGFFNRTCDVVFTALTPRKVIDAPVQILDYATGPDRMFAQQGFQKERERMLDLVLKVKRAA